MLLSHLTMPALVEGLFISAVSEMLIYEERWLFNSYVIARLLLSLPRYEHCPCPLIWLPFPVSRDSKTRLS